MSGAIAKIMAPLARRVRLMVSRCVVLKTDADAGTQTAQVRLYEGEVRDKVECLEQFGFTSRPLAGANGLMLSLGGNHDIGFLIVRHDRRYRPTDLEPGETCIYSDEDKAASDHRIHFKSGKEIHIIAGASSIVMTPAGITITTPQLDIDQG